MSGWDRRKARELLAFEIKQHLFGDHLEVDLKLLEDAAVDLEKALARIPLKGGGMKPRFHGGIRAVIPIRAGPRGARKGTTLLGRPTLRYTLTPTGRLRRLPGCGSRRKVRCRGLVSRPAPVRLSGSWGEREGFAGLVHRRCCSNPLRRLCGGRTWLGGGRGRRIAK
ncbi:hypothetical protein PVAP13_1KG518704 [Panicum virgatum]|uniref:Uncharacterized protein n=1 Tax=Panicum virgatum TaxID=38727 RepID=A0A8T0XVK6_PANVG|nr:hypothetical protein PVAP13_1KG518704 [Panicum virgatum]